MSNSTVHFSDFDNTLQPRSLDQSNSFGLACRASRVFMLSSLSQLPAVTTLCQVNQQVLVLGGGSNLVLPPVLERVVIKVALQGISLVQPCAVASDAFYRIDVAAGENWHNWVVHATKQGWYGLENLALIPGTVGASPVQNIGAYGLDVQERIESVTAWHIPEGRLVTLSRAQCGFTYRDSVFKSAPLGTWLIVSVRFALPKRWIPVLTYPDLRSHPVLSAIAASDLSAQHILDAVCDIRSAKLPDPAVLGNAGSFFKNPIVSFEQYLSLKQQFSELVGFVQPDSRYKLSAGWMIEHSGWKGKRLGQVGVHDRQALVLVNYGGAQASDLLNLAEAICASVRTMFDVELEIEPVVVTDNKTGQSMFKPVFN